MHKTRKRMFMILGSAAGTAAAIYGIRKGLQWWNNREEMAMYNDSWVEQRAGKYDTSAPMPQTPGQPPARTMDQPPTYPPQQSPAQSPSQGQQRSEQMSQAQTQPRYQPVDQPDRQTIPTTGPSAAPAAEFSAATMNRETQTDVPMDSLVSPLIEYAIAFNSVMTLLRSKQRDSDTSGTGQAFTPGDRTSMRNVLEQLRERLPEMVSEGEVEQNPLQLRTYRLVVKLRDALESLDYTESDLFRVNGEVRSELCRLTIDLQQSGKVGITGLDQVRQLYECE